MLRLVKGAKSSAAAREIQGERADARVTEHSGIRVLVVDDEPSIVKALSMSLSRAGFEAIGAMSGASAIAIVNAEVVDVLVLDLRIPDMRGDVLFEVAAGHQAHLRSNTLFITGDVTERARKLISACQCPCLRKPFDLGEFIAAVSALPRVRPPDPPQPLSRALGLPGESLAG